MRPILPPSFTLLQVIPRLDGGGVERATLDMAAAVKSAGGRSLVASCGGAMAAELMAAGGELIRLPVDRRDPVSLFANAGKLAEVIRREGVSVVHFRSRAPAFSAIRAARRAGVPVVATYHGIYSARSAAKRWYNGVMTRGDLVIANSQFTRDHILGEHPIAPDRVVVVPEGIDTRRFDPSIISAERVAAIRETWGLKGDDRRRVILCAARLTSWKGQGTAIEAFGKRARRENAVLILAGRTESETYADALRRLAADLGVADSVKLVGQIDDMAAALLAADIVVAPSLAAESFGRAVVEAMAMGRPAVASAIGAHLETVADGETGWLVEPADRAAWTRALETVQATPPDVLAEMGRLARDRAVDRYSLDAMVDATFEVYRRLLSHDR